MAFIELTEEEATCVARHLIAQHRQDIFNRISSVSEACEKCPINSNCFDNSGKDGLLWGKVYKKICKFSNVKYSFMIGEYPLVPYEKEDSR